jgi:hypothetical protein
MGQNLTGQTIASTYEDLVQISGSVFTDGLGNDITSATITASNAISSSYALTASFALNAGGADTGSLMVTGSVNLNTLTFTKGDGSTFNLTVDTGSAVTVNTGSLLVTASISDATTTYTKGDGSTFALVTNNVQNASTSSYVATAVLTGSVSSNTLTFTKFDGSTFDLTVDTGSAVTIDTGSFMITGSQPLSLDQIFFEKGDGSTFDITIDNVANAGFAFNATNAATASIATSASFAQTASFAFNAATASYLETGFYATASFSGSTWTFNHNLNKSYVVIECYDVNNEEIIPQTIDLTSSNQAVITFPVIVEGVALASLGNGIVTGLDPISIYSQGQSQSSTVRTQTLIVDTAAVYNIHISQSGNHLVDVTGLTSGTGASLNMYFYPESFTNVGDQAFMTFLIGSGSGTALTIKSLVSASAGFGYFMSGITIGSATFNLSRQASVQSKLFGNLGTVPTIITKTIDGIYFGSTNAPIAASSFIQSGSQGTPI